MKISEILKPSLIKVRLQSETKEELFDEMVQLFVDEGLLKDRDVALNSLLEREEKMSTGVARWLGLPHARVPEVKGVLMAVGVSEKGVDYGSLDGQPVYIVFMLFAEVGNAASIYLRALADVCRLFSNPVFTERIRAARTSFEVLELIRQEE